VISKWKSQGEDHGFTIMEVMVAVMILAVSVVAIFGAQFAAVATTDFSQYTTQAIELARCRMSEIELEIQVENGFEEADVASSGECCEMLEGESDIADFSCNWEIKTVELPDLTTLMTGGPDGGGGMLDDLGLGGDSMEDFSAMGMASAFAPMLSEMLRQAIRRVTVTVEWEQGAKKREFVLSQYLTHPTQGPLELMQAAATAEEWSETNEEEGLSPTEGSGRYGEGSTQGRPMNRPMDRQ
jgi:prepilin-type N-terminal cleavage/methylation domain-containing protein